MLLNKVNYFKLLVLNFDLFYVMEESLPVTPRSILHNSVRSLLNKWDGYQIAIINNSGGIETTEKDKW